MKRILATIATALTALVLYGQGRTAVIFDNDFAGDPDGLYALAQMMRSTSIDVRAIVCSHLHEGENWSTPGAPAPASGVEEVRKLQQVMQADWAMPVLRGSDTALTATDKPEASEGAMKIVEEAMKHDSSDPLFVLCGGGLTEIATAWLVEPAIEERIILVWIGGEEYPGTMPTPRTDAEYNTTIDIRAAQVVFNRSRIPLWQIPRNAYRQCLISWHTLAARLDGSATGRYLNAKIERFAGPGSSAEAYVLGDSPLVLVTALRTNWEPDAASSHYEWRDRPEVKDDGRFTFTASESKVRVYRTLDTYLMFEDMFAKLRRP